MTPPDSDPRDRLGRAPGDGVPGDADPRFPALAFPPGTPFTLREHHGRLEIRDPVRRRFVALTPEEWVRQHLIRLMVERLGYPIGLLAVEKGFGQGLRRADVVALDRLARPVVIAECKAPSVALTQSVLDQVSRYNAVAEAPVLAVTNGLRHAVWRVDRTARTLDFLATLPRFEAVGSEDGGQ